MVHANNLNLKYPKIKNQFLAAIEFGMPSKECRNFGICQINPIRGMAFPEKKKRKAIVTLLDNNQLEMSFLKASIPSKDYQNFLAKKDFLVEESYTFRDKVKLALSFRILPGRYSINEQSSLISITFQLDKKYFPINPLLFSGFLTSKTDQN